MPVDITFILDWAARIGVQAKLDGVSRAQLESLLASLETVEDPKHCVLVTAAFAERQAARLGGRRMARLVNEALSEIYKEGGGREEARKLLGLAKWVFEAIERVRFPISPSEVDKLTFREFLDRLRRAR